MAAATMPRTPPSKIVGARRTPAFPPTSVDIRYEGQDGWRKRQSSKDWPTSPRKWALMPEPAAAAAAAAAATPPRYWSGYCVHTDGKMEVVVLPLPTQTNLRHWFHAKLVELAHPPASEGRKGLVAPGDVEVEAIVFNNGWQLWRAKDARYTQPVNTKATKLFGPNDDDHITTGDNKWYGRLLVCKPLADDLVATVQPTIDDFFGAVLAMTLDEDITLK